jgi:hypothetical protein
MRFYERSSATVVWTKITPPYDLLSDAVRSCAADFVKERTFYALVIASFTSVAKIFGYFVSTK